MVDTHEHALDRVPPKPMPSPTPERRGESEPSPRKILTEVVNEVVDPFVITQTSVPFDVAASQEATRARIAWLFTTVFLAMIGTAFALPTVANVVAPKTFADPLTTSRELATTLASILAGPFGFIVGFYFKKDEDS